MVGLVRSVAVLILLAGMCGARGVRAEIADYDSLVDEAVSEYNRGHFTEAFALFEQAHAIDANARTLRGMALCAYELRHYVQAVTLLQGAQTESRKALDVEQSHQVASFLAKARRFIGEIEIETEPTDTAVQVDGAKVASHKFMLDAGDHTLVVSASGYHSDSWTLTVTGGQSIVIHRQLARLEVSPAQVARADASKPVLAASSTKPQADVVDSSGGLLSRWWFWTIVGVVAAGAVTGAVLAVNSGGGVDRGSSGALLHAP